MKTSIITVFILIAFSSCGSKDPREKIPFIGGYWEIKSVEMPNGSSKKFTTNKAIDYIEIKGDSGIRKKLMPRLDGSFKTFNTSEKFRFIVRNDSLIMFYQTPYANWLETVIKATDSVFIVKNRDQKKYVYKRYNKTVINR